MTIPRRFAEAREILGVDDDADARAVKRAYRKKVAEHAPDRDPIGFKRVREAYERLARPTSELEPLLRYRLPYVDLPELPEPEAADPDHLHRLLLETAVQRLDVDELLR